MNYFKQINREGIPFHHLGGCLILASVLGMVLFSGSDGPVYSRYFGFQSSSQGMWEAFFVIGVLLILAHYVFFGRKNILLKGSGTSYILYKHYNRLILCTVCGTVGLYETCIVLTKEERRQFHEEGEAYIKNLSDQITHYPPDFMPRNIRF